MAKNKKNLYVKYKMISYKAKGKRKKLPQKMACDRTASQTAFKNLPHQLLGSGFSILFKISHLSKTKT